MNEEQGKTGRGVNQKMKRMELIRSVYMWKSIGNRIGSQTFSTRGAFLELRFVHGAFNEIYDFFLDKNR